MDQIPAAVEEMPRLITATTIVVPAPSGADDLGRACDGRLLNAHK